MIVRIGNKEVYNSKLFDYKGELVTRNKKLAEDIIKGRLTRKQWVAMGVTATVLMGALIGLIDPTSAFASTHHAVATMSGIDTKPLTVFFHEIYTTMLKVVIYLTIPVWAWVGYTLAFSGANVEKRTMAKKIATSLIIGVGFIVGAPWIADQIYNIWVHVFSV